MRKGSYISRIETGKLMGIYHRFLVNPNRVFIAKDLNAHHIGTYIHILESLNAIRLVPVIRKIGKYNVKRRIIKGYKLNKDNQHGNQI